MKKILITGADGFVGKAIAMRLCEYNHLYLLTRQKERFSNAKSMIMIYVDLTDPDFANNLPRDIDCVIHLAQSARYRDFPGGVNDIQLVNIVAMIQLLEWARKTKVKQFIFTSTANVYAPSVEPFTEESPAIPTSFYGASKLAAEHLARQFQQYFQVDILRLFTVYGPGQRSMLIPNIVERIRLNQEIILAEGVGVILSPIFINDVVSVIEKMIGDSPKDRSRLLNVCGDHASSLLEIIETLEFLLKQKALIRRIDSGATFLVGRNDRLKELIGNYQFVDMNSGLEKVVTPGVILK